MAQDSSANADRSLERERWEKEIELREREVAVKEAELGIKVREAGIKDREQQLKSRELQLRVIELRRSRLTNPLFLAIVGAVVAAVGTAIGAGIAAWSQLSLEEKKTTTQLSLEERKATEEQQIEKFKADSTLILEVIKTNNDAAKARANLDFLVGAGLIADKARRDELASYLKGPGPVPSLPSSAQAASPSQPAALACTMPADVDAEDVGKKFKHWLDADGLIKEISIGSTKGFAIIDVTWQGPSSGDLPARGRFVFFHSNSATTLKLTFEGPALDDPSSKSSLAPVLDTSRYIRALDNVVGAEKAKCTRS